MVVAPWVAFWLWRGFRFGVAPWVAFWVGFALGVAAVWRAAGGAEESGRVVVRLGSRQPGGLGAAAFAWKTMGGLQTNEPEI